MSLSRGDIVTDPNGEKLLVVSDEFPGLDGKPWVATQKVKGAAIYWLASHLTPVVATSTPTTTMPPGCPKFPIGCMCKDCVDRQDWYWAQQMGGPTPAPVNHSVRGTAAPTPVSGNTKTWSVQYPAAMEALLGAFGDTETGTINHPEAAKLPPLNCRHCNHRNEYAGPEHLIDGAYVCRQCRPRLGLKVVGT